MIINSSYFLYKPLFIPQSVSSVPPIGVDTPSYADDLTAFIDLKESELLLSFLGYEQYTELLNQFNEDGSFKDNALQKWKDLVDGSGSWRGLRYNVGAFKKSIIANYVYFYWLGEWNSSVTTLGVQNPESANSQSISPNDKQFKIWNDFLILYGYNEKYFNAQFFKNWNGCGLMWAGNDQNSNVISLYKYMSNNQDLYDISKFCNYSNVNPYNL